MAIGLDVVAMVWILLKIPSAVIEVSLESENIENQRKKINDSWTNLGVLGYHGAEKVENNYHHR